MFTAVCSAAKMASASSDTVMDRNAERRKHVSLKTFNTNPKSKESTENSLSTNQRNVTQCFCFDDYHLTISIVFVGKHVQFYKFT